MTDLDRLLADAFDDPGRQAPHDPDLAGSVRRRARRHGAVTGSVLAVLAVAGVSTVVAVGRSGGAPVEPGGGTPASASATTPPPAAVCRAPETGVLPEWAWTGFSDPKAGGYPFVRGDRNGLVAILFGPLTSPARPGHNNKVLWVANPTPPGPVSSPPPDSVSGAVVEARLEGTGPPIRRELAGLGPSIVDLPAPGCWHLTVTWGPYRDTLSLRYAPG
jgi:hypothetical protein